jgi:protein-S-isoprenylcysteine O-methyltransferase Ste14
MADAALALRTFHPQGDQLAELPRPTAALPLIHSATGVWIAFSIMVFVGVGLGLFFWRQRCLGTHHPP